MSATTPLGKAGIKKCHPGLRLSRVNLFELMEVILMVISTLLVFTRNFDTEGMGKVLTNAAIIGFVIFEAAACLSRRNVYIHPAVAIFAFFLCFCWCSVFWSVSLERSLSRVQSLSIMLIYYLALTNFALTRVEKQERLAFFAKVLVIASLLASVYLLVNSDWQSGTRVSGVIGDANQASVYLSYAIPVSLYCADKGLIPKWLAVLNVCLIVFSVGVMGSRTGLFVVAIGIILYLTIHSIQRGISMQIIVVPLVLIIGIVVTVNFIMTNELAYDIIGSRFESLFDILSGESSKINENSYYERQELFNLAVELFLMHPIAGVGIDGYAYFAAITIRDTFSHNDYMQLLSCVGIIGFLLYYAQHIYLASGFRYLGKKEFAMSLTLLTMILICHAAVVFYYQKLEFVYLSFLICVVAAGKMNQVTQKDN